MIRLLLFILCWGMMRQQLFPASKNKNPEKSFVSEVISSFIYASCQDAATRRDFHWCKTGLFPQAVALNDQARFIARSANQMKT
ncbi:MAG TPA: hypothetical protein VNK52_15120 [Hyphomicrobiaceae bacterium]|nr:hypothetical protein [Hyphomicrobiaceae bacterium]